MENREWTFIDKTSWGEGQWQNEPDKVQWLDQVTGLPCLALRQEHSGHWCGYVGTSEGHPYFQMGYNMLDEIAVHGVLTFADACSGDEHGICHVMEPGEPDHVWWFGFDCAHGGDYSPAMAKYGDLFRPNKRESYKTLDYVRQECASLAMQLAKLAE